MAALRTLGAVKALVYDAVFKRAQEIAASEKLRLIVFEGESLLQGTAECIGSSLSEVYSLIVSIDGSAAVGDCSCPAGKSAKQGLCKHAVALLLKRVQKLQMSETIPPVSSSKEEVISIASQSDYYSAANQDARESADGREADQSTMAQGNGPPASGSKRALPAWMLGAVGRSTDQTQPSNKAKSNNRAAEPKPPRPVHPPTKRAKRSGQPLKISDDSGKEEEEDPGEVCDAGPIEKCPAPVVREDVEVPETCDLPSEGAAARERRRLKNLKKEAHAAAVDNSDEVVKRTRGRSGKAITNEMSDDKGNDEVKRPKGRSSRAVTEEVSDQPLLLAKRRRLTRKYVDEDSESEAAPMDADTNICFGLTDEDLLFLAQEQVEKEKATWHAEDLGPKAASEPVEEKLAETSFQGKKSSSSIFSMNKWKDMSSEGRGTGGALTSAPADFDWETLKNYTLGVGSQSFSQIDRPPSSTADISDGVLQNLQTADVAPELRDVPALMPEAAASDELNAVKNDMFEIFFGSSLSQNVAKNVTAASYSPNASHDMPNHRTTEVGLEPPTTSYFVSESVNVVPALPAIKPYLGDPTSQPNTKKKSSLKDRVKMFLS